MASDPLKKAEVEELAARTHPGPAACFRVRVWASIPST